MNLKLVLVRKNLFQILLNKMYSIHSMTL